MIANVFTFIDKATVRNVAYVMKNEEDDNALVNPTAVTIFIYDPDGVQKAGYISVSASATFTAGLTVTGATSLATGLVISKPDGTTLELQGVTGVWESGETIEDTSTGTSTTTSALLAAAMTVTDDTGIYEYSYHKGAGVAAMDSGNWRVLVLVADGTGIDTVYSPEPHAFEVG